MPTFALDTATPSPSLALVAGHEPVAELWLAPTPDGGRRVLQAAHGLLSACGLTARDLDRVVVGVGPGGFTGLRIGVATALGLGQALGIPVVGASSLEALALGIGEVAGPGALVAPLIDARRGELFAAAYRTGPGDALEELMAPRAVRPSALAADLSRLARDGGPAWIGGDGAEAGGGHLAVSATAKWPELRGPLLRGLPAGATAARQRAANLVRRVASGAARPAVPTYLRLPDAEVNRRRSAAEAPAA